MRNLFNEMRWGATLGDRRFRSAELIAELSGYGIHNIRLQLQRMEARGEVEVRRGVGFAHGNKKLYRIRRGR